MIKQLTKAKILSPDDELTGAGLLNRLNFTPIAGSTYVDLSLTDGDPRFATAAVDSYAKLFAADRNRAEAARLQRVIRRLEAVAVDLPRPTVEGEPSQAQAVREKIRIAREFEAVAGDPTLVMGDPIVTTNAPPLSRNVDPGPRAAAGAGHRGRGRAADRDGLPQGDHPGRRRGGVRAAVHRRGPAVRHPADPAAGDRPPVQPGGRGLPPRGHGPGAPGPRERYPGAGDRLGRAGRWPDDAGRQPGPFAGPPGARGGPGLQRPAPSRGREAARPRAGARPGRGPPGRTHPGDRHAGLDQRPPAGPARRHAEQAPGRAAGLHAAPRDHPGPAADGHRHPRHAAGHPLGGRDHPVQRRRRHPVRGQVGGHPHAVGAGGYQAACAATGSASSAMVLVGTSSPWLRSLVGPRRRPPRLGPTPSWRSWSRCRPRPCRSTRGPPPAPSQRRSPLHDATATQAAGEVTDLKAAERNRRAAE